MGVPCQRSIAPELCSQQGDGDFFVAEELLAAFPRGGMLHCGSRCVRYFKSWFTPVVCFKQEYVMGSENTFCGICFQQRRSLFFSRMIAVVTMMFLGRDFCDACPFLVPPNKARATASSMVRWAPNGSKYTLTSWWALGGALCPEWWKKLREQGLCHQCEISHKAPTAQLSRQYLEMCCAYGVTWRWCFTYVPFWIPVKLLVFMSVSVCVCLMLDFLWKLCVDQTYVLCCHVLL